MPSAATTSVNRTSVPAKSSSENLPDVGKIPTAPGSTSPTIGLSGANTEPVPVAPAPGPRFREGRRQSGGFGKIRSTPSEPCPVCGRSGCSYSDDRVLLVCWRGNGGTSVAGWRYVGPGKSGGETYALEAGGDRGVFSSLVRLPDRISGSAVWEARVAGYLEHADADQRRRELAADLGVDVWSLAGLSVGWKPGAHGVGAWTYPQRSADGAIVSVGLRLDRAEDRQRYDSDGGRTKSPAGLIYVPGRWLASTGPVLVVEGMTDVAALDSLRLDAVGHPGNSPRGPLLDELERLLRAVPDDRPIVAVAERDPGREDDQDSPGRKGARTKAQSLANRLGRRVGVALPPDGAKDSRAWVREKWSAGGHVSALRETFVSGLLAAVDWFDPEPSKSEPPARVEPLVDAGEEVDLESYRADMRRRLADFVAADKPRGRLAVLGGPAGSGKTTAVDEIAVPAYDEVLAGIPTHENARERVEALRRLPILEDHEVAAYPKLSPETCISFTAEQADELRSQGHKKATSAERAQRYGFGVRATACRFCPLAPWKEAPAAADTVADLDQFSPERVFAEHDGGSTPVDAAATVEESDEFSSIRCSYWRAVARADAARVRVATLERVKRTAATAVRKEARSLVTIDERGFETVFPVASVDVRLLDELAEGLEGAALRMEAEHAGKDETVERPTSCQCGATQTTMERVGGVIFDRCTNCGATRGSSRIDGRDKRPKRRPADADGLFDAADDRDRRRRSRERSRERDQREREAATRRAESVAYVRSLAETARTIAERLREKADRRGFGSDVVPVVRISGSKSRRMTDDEVVLLDHHLAPGGKPAPLVVRGKIVKQPARVLADVLERSLPPGAIVAAEALELVRRVHARRVDRLVLHVEELDGGERSTIPEADRRVALTALATWGTALPPAADVLVLDGTLDVAGFAKRLGRDVEEISPPSRVRRQSLAVQLAHDVTRATSPRTAAKILEQALAALPDSKRVGVILLARHEDALFPRDRKGNRIRTPQSRELVPDDVFARIAVDESGELLVEHYNGGRDRASNDWIQHCDGLVLLGTPRPRAISVVEELVRRLDDEALARGSDWGPVLWDAKTRDGRVVRCRGRGYADPAWAAAADAVTRTGLVQALERARTVLPTAGDADGRPGGIPVVVVSGEPTGLPVVESLPDAVSRGARRVVDVVRRLLEQPAAAENPCPPCEDRGSGDQSEAGPTCATTPIRRGNVLIGRVAQVADHGGTVLARLVLDAIVAGMDGSPVPVRTARLWISQAVEAGIVTRSGSTRATVYGLPETSVPPVVVEEPEAPAADPAPGELDDQDLEAWLERPDVRKPAARPPMPASVPWKTDPDPPTDLRLPRPWGGAPVIGQRVGRAHRVRVADDE